MRGRREVDLDQGLDLLLEVLTVREDPADVLGLVDQVVASELRSFKRVLEERGQPTGRWAGQIPSPDESARR